MHFTFFLYILLSLNDIRQEMTFSSLNVKGQGQNSSCLMFFVRLNALITFTSY
jgi:hypothetical protein